MRILSFNLLNPIYASPKWYPGVNVALLNTKRRLQRIAKFLERVGSGIDVLVFQEVGVEAWQLLKKILPGYTGAVSFNAPEYWSDDVVPPLQPGPNGVAIFVRGWTQLTFTPHQLSTGNYPLVAEGCVDGKRIKVVGVHLDSNSRKRRERELRELLDWLPTECTTLVVGDMNSSIRPKTKVEQIFAHYGFHGVLESTGTAGPTHPFDQEDHDPAYNPTIDHIMVVHARPIGGNIFSGHIMKNPNETERIEETLRLLGSDHFPIMGVIDFHVKM